MGKSAKLTSHGCTIHNLKFRDSFTFVVLVRHCSCRLPSNNREFHMLDFYPNEEEIDFANDDILQMVPKDAECFSNGTAAVNETIVL